MKVSFLISNLKFVRRKTCPKMKVSFLISNLKFFIIFQMPLSRRRDRERKRFEGQSRCAKCKLATLYPDGAMRCDLTKETVEPSRPACRKRISGTFKLFERRFEDGGRIGADD